MNDFLQGLIIGAIIGSSCFWIGYYIGDERSPTPKPPKAQEKTVFGNTTLGIGIATAAVITAACIPFVAGVVFLNC